MWSWIDDHLSLIIASTVGMVAGFVGGVKMFLGLKDDVRSLSKRVAEAEEAVTQIQRDSDVAAEQRRNMIDKIDETNENVNRLIEHLLNK